VAVVVDMVAAAEGADVVATATAKVAGATNRDSRQRSVLSCAGLSWVMAKRHSFFAVPRLLNDEGSRGNLITRDKECEELGRSFPLGK
jgi:hypothetical protein